MINVGLTYGGQSYENPTTYAAIELDITGGVTEVMYCPWCGDMFIQIVATGLSSVNTLVVTAEGGLDNSNWDNLDANDASTTISSNGTTLLYFPGSVTPYVRVSGLSNAPAVVGCKAFFGRVS